MSSVGYYRYKISDTVEGVSTVKIFSNGALTTTATIITKPFCSDFKLLKYLDSSGRYRFFPFNKYWQQVDKPTLIGNVNSFVTSIIDSQSSKKNIGYTNERKLTLVAEQVSLAELEVLSDIFVSPRVYMLVGSTDELSDWILVTVTGDGIGRPKKANYKKVTIEVTLPERYAITKI